MPQRTKKTVSAIAAVLLSVLGQNAIARSTHALPADNHVSVTSSGSVQLHLDLPIGQNRDVLAGANVTLVDRNGVAKKYTADADGVVELTDIAAGPYAVVASSGNVYASTILSVHDTDAPQQAPSMMRMPMAVVNTKKLAPWMETFVGQLSKKQAAQLGQVMTEIEPEASQFGYRVKLREGGILEGQLVSILSDDHSNISLADTEVILMQNGIAVGKSYTNEFGEFHFKGVRTGVHGIVAAGSAGYATFAFEVVEESGLASESALGHKFVSYASADLTTTLPVTLVPPSMIPGVVDPFGSISPDAGLFQTPAPTLTSTGFSSGGMGGASFGGGGVVNGGAGGGFGGSGGGGIGLLGAAAAGIAIPLAVDGDDDNDAGPVASPSGT
ncbi:hypothetical protein Q31b_52230 [Novipirellula aureliae]|uniref:Cna protein B-type domain protein n=1 Tax=Novipirellula aureliae TaxID=2527966 RepID=A0A5C6DGD0_9BACT|nr:hypothetical protein [Novipirellula aureliae]TWU35788.1 hypothetical protein Q31b_52230 [Novipirellula aureliae]